MLIVMQLCEISHPSVYEYDLYADIKPTQQIIFWYIERCVLIIETQFSKKVLTEHKTPF